MSHLSRQSLSFLICKGSCLTAKQSRRHIRHRSALRGPCHPSAHRGRPQGSTTESSSHILRSASEPLSPGFPEPTLSRGLGVLPSPRSSGPHEAPDAGYECVQVIRTKPFSRGGILRISCNWPVMDGAVVVGFLQSTTALKARETHGMMATLRRYSDPREASWRPPPAQPLPVMGGTKITVRSVKTAEGDVGCGVRGVG